MTKRKNFMNQQTPSTIDDVYVECNFGQDGPDERDGKKVGVRLFPGDDTPRTFIDCQMTNCEPPPGSKLEGCQTILMERDVLLESVTVLIGDEEIDASRRGQRVYGKYQDGDYVYFDPPRDHEEVT